MKTKSILLLTLLFALALTVEAQKDHIDSLLTNSKLKAEDNIINQVNSKVNQKINDIFSGNKRKKKDTEAAVQAATDAAAAKNTLLSFENVDYTALNNWAKKLKQQTKFFGFSIYHFQTILYAQC